MNIAWNKLILYPQGGLGNRMRSINSAINFCDSNRLNLKVVWIKDTGINCDYFDLFDADERFELASVGKLHVVFLKLLERVYRLFPAVFNMFGYYVNINVKHKVNPSHRRIKIWTCGKFFEYSRIFIRFNQEITFRSEEFTKLFTIDTYGIHLRLSDNEKAIANSSPETFIKKIGEVLRDNENATFFLSTDEQHIKQRFISLFGNKIITREANLGRNSSAGIVDAAVDMICLSKTKLIYASYYTSFSEVASEITGVKRVVLVNNSSTSSVLQ